MSQAGGKASSWSLIIYARSLSADLLVAVKHSNAVLSLPFSRVSPGAELLLLQSELDNEQNKTKGVVAGKDSGVGGDG